MLSRSCWRVPPLLTLGWLLFALLSTGCGNKQLEELAAKAQQGIDQAKQKAGAVGKQAGDQLQQLPGAVASVTAGEIKLTLDVPLNATTCSARFTPPGKSHGGLFQIGTNVSTAPDSFPAVYFHAPTDALSLQELVGKTIHGTLFVAKAAEQGHYQSAGDKPLALQIVKLENDVVTCQLQNGELHSLEQPQPTPVGGSLVGAVRP